MTGTGNAIKMDCATCHDPHGSANYRILKAVGQRQHRRRLRSRRGRPRADPDPDGFVSSVETGWPVNGFRLHTPYPGYKPNYTTPMYAKGYDMPTRRWPTAHRRQRRQGHERLVRWLSQHLPRPVTDVHQDRASDHDHVQSFASTYNAGDGGGLALRHKHPINVRARHLQRSRQELDDRHRHDSAAGSRHRRAGRADQRGLGLDRVPDVPPCPRYGCRDDGLGVERRCRVDRATPTVSLATSSRHANARFRQRSAALRQPWRLRKVPQQVGSS